MKVLKVLTLQGPNIWSRRSVLEAWVDLGPELDNPSTAFPGFYERLTAWVPSLIEHRCSVGERGGFLKRLREGTYPAHILEHVTLELQTLSGSPVGFGKARETSTPHVYKVAIRYQVEPLVHACFEAARELVLAAIYDQPFDIAKTMARLREVADNHALGPSTASIVAAAEARNIPARRLNDGSLVQLGQGSRQRRLWTAETDRTGAVAEYIAKDKDLTKRLLHEAGVPIPHGRVVESEADAWEAAQDIGLPVVVKPRDGNHGRAVFVELTKQAEIEAAFRDATKEGNGVLVERFIKGREHRLLVVGNHVAAAARGETAYVTGDGQHTVAELVELQLNSDPLRGLEDDCPLNPVELDSVSVMILEHQGFQVSSVPPTGARVLIQRNGNVAHDVTDLVHPEVAHQVVMAARVVGLDIAGIDVVAEDIGQPLEAQGGAIVEVNSSPGLHAHLRPATGKPRPVGEAIVELIFAQGDMGRIPVACVTGTNGKTVVTTLLSRLLGTTGRTVGTASTEGLFVSRKTGERALQKGDCADASSAKRLLLNPVVDTAVFEASHASILSEGLGFDRCDVAVVTNIADGDHLGHHYIDTPEQMFGVKRCAVDMVLPNGAAVLKADDPLVADMASLSQGGVVLFCREADQPVFRSHVAQGKQGVAVVDGQVTLFEEGNERRLFPLAELSMTRKGTVGFQVENVLAATAAAWAMGMNAEALTAAWRQLEKNAAASVTGRFEVFEAHGAMVVVDDCQNPAALAAAIEALGTFKAERRHVVLGSGFGRAEAQLVRLGELLGGAFSTLHLFPGQDPAKRPFGMAPPPPDPHGVALLKQGVAKAGRKPTIVEHMRHAEALGAALAALNSGDVLFVQAEESSVDSAVARVRRWAEGVR